MTKTELETLGKSLNLDKVLKTLKTEKIVAPGDTWEKVPFWRLKKDVTDEEGFSGRIGVHEIFKVSPAIKEIILKSGTTDDIQAQAEKEGMLTMIEDGIFKAVLGITTVEEVLSVVLE